MIDPPAVALALRSWMSEEEQSRVETILWWADMTAYDAEPHETGRRSVSAAEQTLMQGR
jgi:hypothetical protein